MLPARVSSDGAGVYRETFSANQSFSNATAQAHFKQMAEGIAVAKATMPVLGKAGMLGHSIPQA